MKRKLLWYGEAPDIETGASQLSKNLLPLFQEMFDSIHLVCINHWWEGTTLTPEQQNHVYMEHGTPDDIWNVARMREALKTGDYTHVFLSTDINRITDLLPELEIPYRHQKPIIMYAAIDCLVLSRFFLRILSLATTAVVFSQFSYRVVTRVLPEIIPTLEIIYHGCETSVFYPLAVEERQQARIRLFGLDDDTFLVINVNRNQVRKDLVRTMGAFHAFYQTHPHSRLYLHAKQQDNGGNLIAQCQALGLQTEGSNPEVMFTGTDYTEISGYARSDMNLIYNCADVCISTTTGEGWGLTTTEAMSAGKLFIGPNNTVFPEILGKKRERGILVKSGGIDLWVTFYGITDMPRELTSTSDMARALRWAYHHPTEASHIGQRARAWCCDHTWEHIRGQWRLLWQKILAT